MTDAEFIARFDALTPEDRAHFLRKWPSVYVSVCRTVERTRIKQRHRERRQAFWHRLRSTG